MSVRDLIYEELERYGINRSRISNLEVEGPFLNVYLHSEKEPISIDEPYIVKLVNCELDREDLLKMLYGLRTVFEGMTVPFSKFVSQTMKMSTNEILEEIEKLREKYSDQFPYYREGLEVKFIKKLTETCGGSFKDYEELIKEYHFTIKDLLDNLAVLYS